MDMGDAQENQVANNLFWSTKKAVTGFAGQEAITADPLLVGEGMDIHPGPGSPAIDHALPLAEVKCDRLGAARPAGRGPDIGAVEVPSTGAPASLVELRAIPPFRPSLDLGALKGEVLFAMDAADPMKGLVAAGGAGSGKFAVTGPAVKLTDTCLWLEQELASDFVAEWEYQPELLATKGDLRFAAAGRKGGYTLGFGGAQGESPDGTITISCRLWNRSTSERRRKSWKSSAKGISRSRLAAWNEARSSACFSRTDR